MEKRVNNNQKISLSNEENNISNCNDAFIWDNSLRRKSRSSRFEEPTKSFELTNTQLEYEKAVVHLAEVKRKASTVNAEANNSVVTGLSTRNPEASAKAAKDRVKILKEANKMNKKVAKEEKKVENIQKKIEKLQGEIDKLRQKVEFVGRW